MLKIDRVFHPPVGLLSESLARVWLLVCGPEVSCFCVVQIEGVVMGPGALMNDFLLPQGRVRGVGVCALCVSARGEQTTGMETRSHFQLDTTSASCSGFVDVVLGTSRIRGRLLHHRGNVSRCGCIVTSCVGTRLIHGVRGRTSVCRALCTSREGDAGSQFSVFPADPCVSN